MARRRKVRRPPAGKTTFRGRDQAGNDLFPPYASPGPALTRTQAFAERTPEENTYYVERQTLFGPAVDLYEVVRDEHGSIRTYTLSHED